MTICIIGLGLIGGSLGMALKRADKNLEVIGVDLNNDIIQKAIDLKAIDRGTCSPEEGAASADLVFVATDLSKTTDIIGKIVPILKEGAILSDVGSTKLKISREIANLLKERKDVSYVGGHPMAGSEKSGIIAADPYLFENAVYVILKDEGNDNARKTVTEIIEKTGARILFLNAREHDEMVAAISHLPHLLASVLVNVVGEVEKVHEDVFKIAAGGFRDVTRVADGQPELWRDIFYSNRDALLLVLDIYKKQIEDIESLLISEGKEELTGFLTRARALRNQVPKKVKGLLPALSEIVVTIPDKPGEIGRVANILGAKEINIIDIEILRVREGDGGTLRLGFTKEDERKRAIEVLNFFGYITKII